MTNLKLIFSLKDKEICFILRIACQGIKHKLAPGDQKALALDVMRWVYRNYINPSKRKRIIECIDAETCKVVESKMSNLDEQNIDPNIFDGAFDLTVNHLSTKFYPNFLTSDIFVDYVRVSNTFCQSLFFFLFFLGGGGGGGWCRFLPLLKWPTFLRAAGSLPKIGWHTKSTRMTR